jgi:hypothetical protein
MSGRFHTSVSPEAAATADTSSNQSTNEPVSTTRTQTAAHTYRQEQLGTVSRDCCPRQQRYQRSESDGNVHEHLRGGREAGVHRHRCQRYDGACNTAPHTAYPIGGAVAIGEYDRLVQRDADLAMPHASTARPRAFQGTAAQK